MLLYSFYNEMDAFIELSAPKNLYTSHIKSLNTLLKAENYENMRF